jgi:hypothetical protein
MKQHLAKSWLKSIALGILLTVLPADSYAQGRVIVFGLDETGSYSFRKKAIAIAKSIIAGMKPGEVFYARRITHNSYDDSCAVFRLEIPQIGKAPSNRFDPRARSSWQKKVKRVSLLKSEAIGVLSKLGPVKAPMTDIWGFLAAAADRIQAEHGPDFHPVVIITSDMKDNCHRKTDMDLNGAEILIAGFESGKDPKKAYKIKSNWKNGFKRCNAASVTFLPPDCKLLLHITPQNGGK